MELSTTVLCVMTLGFFATLLALEYQERQLKKQQRLLTGLMTLTAAIILKNGLEMPEPGLILGDYTEDL